MVIELEIEAEGNPEMKVVHEEFANNADTICKFKKEVSRFLLTTDKLDKKLAGLLDSSRIVLGIVSRSFGRHF